MGLGELGIHLIFQFATEEGKHYFNYVMWKLHHVRNTILVILLLNSRPCLAGMFSGMGGGGGDMRGLDNLRNLFLGDPAVDIARIMDPRNIKNIKTIEERDRLFLQVVYCLAFAEKKQPFERDAEEAITKAGIKNGTKGTPYFDIMKEQLLQRLEEAEDYGILSESDMQRLKQGQPPKAENRTDQNCDYIVLEIIPSSICTELKNEIINCRLLRDKSEWNIKEAMRFARRLHDNGLLTDESLNAFKKHSSTNPQ